MIVPLDFFDLPPDAVHVIYLNLSDQRAALATGLDVLDQSEQDRVARYVNPWHGQRYGYSRSLLRHILGRFLHCPPANIVFSYGTYGKPAVDGIDFSLSHCGDWLALAITYGRRIGIDLENLVELRDYLDVARSCFSPLELSKLSQGKDMQQTFCTTWVRKEAVLKAAGRGLDAMQTFCTSVPAVSLSDDRGLPAHWHVRSIETPADHQLALAVEGDPVNHRCFWLDPALGWQGRSQGWEL